MEELTSNQPDFFTEQDFIELQRFAGMRKEDSEEHNQVYGFLRKTYAKVEYWTQQVQQKAFPNGRTGIRKRPTNQANNFSDYLWAQIYPDPQIKYFDSLAFTLDIDTDELFKIKIDTIGFPEDNPIKQRYISFRGDFYESPIVKFYTKEDILPLGWQGLIELTSGIVLDLLPRFELIFDDLLPLIAQRRSETETVANPTPISPSVTESITPKLHSIETTQTTTSLYDFPTLLLTIHETEYLEILYKYFLTETEIQNPYYLQEMWETFPPDFQATKMNHLLVSDGKDITLWGIWHINPTDKIITLFDQVIFAIRNILKKGKNLKDVSSTQILDTIPGISHGQLKQVLKLMSQFQSFHRGSGTLADGTFIIRLEDEYILEQYKKYTGLQTFLNEYLASQGIDRRTNAKKEQNNPTNVQALLELNKTFITRRHSSEFHPVMGVTVLANDLAQIIHSLPSEKGQMIGIFGKWGRGKTFLMKELWKVLGSSETIGYIKVDYHAWKYQETPASWAYLYEQLAKEYLHESEANFFIYYWRLTKLNFKRLGWGPLVKPLLAILAIAGFSLLSLKFHDWYYSLAIIPTVITIFIALSKNLKIEFSTKAIDITKKYTIRHSFKATLGIQADIQEELIKLLKVWIPGKDLKKKKVLLMVEDVDRCTEEKIMQNVDALRIMLEEEEIAKRLVIVTSIDERILKNAIRLKYSSIAEKEIYLENNNSHRKENSNLNININELISEYLDKVFITAIKLGALSFDQKNEYIMELLKNDIADLSKGSIHSSESSGNSGQPPTNDSEEYLIDEYLAPEINETTPQPQPTKQQDHFEKLTTTELRLFQTLVRSTSDITPRRISIIYYRYLLAKNLLISRYDSISEFDLWRDEESIKAIMNLIMHYSKGCDPDQIVKEKFRIEKNNDLDETKISSIPVNKLKKDCLILLDILELIIAY